MTLFLNLYENFSVIVLLQYQNFVIMTTVISELWQCGLVLQLFNAFLSFTWIWIVDNIVAVCASSIHLLSAGPAKARVRSTPADPEYRRKAPWHNLGGLSAALCNQTHPWCTTQEPSPLQTKHKCTLISESQLNVNLIVIKIRNEYSIKSNKPLD